MARMRSPRARYGLLLFHVRCGVSACVRVGVGEGVGKREAHAVSVMSATCAVRRMLGAAHACVYCACWAVAACVCVRGCAVHGTVGCTAVIPHKGGFGLPEVGRWLDARQGAAGLDPPKHACI